MHFYVDPEKVAYRISDGEAVLIHTGTSYYYSLNPVGTFIWEQLSERRRTAEDLTIAVSEEFDQAPDVVAPDVHALLTDLKTEGLIEED